MTENPVPYASSCPRTEAEARWNRLFEAADCHSLLELAVFLGTRQSSVSDARRRGFIPSEWLLTLLRKRWINPVWILTGAGPFFWHPAQNDDDILPVERVAWTSPPEAVLHGRAHNGNRPEGAAADALML